MDEFNTHHEKAYKFLKFKDLEKIITSKKIRFSQPKTFNDPLDCSVLLGNLDWNRYSQMGLKSFKEATVNTYKHFDSFYLTCFSKEYNSELMWAHYGLNNTQVCFEIDFSATPYCGNPSSVTYKDYKDFCLFRDSLHEIGAHEKGIFLATTKLKNWEYEKEVRLIFDTEFKKEYENNGFILSEDNNHIFVNFDINSISKIIFGVNSDEVDEMVMIALTNFNKMNVKFEKMIIDPRDLTLKSMSYFEYILDKPFK
ncbi:MAG: DUF2971 domain-containing protein [Flavobacteriia bacterium]|nr:DUF2971 domain-containing protein [Flavobacteriia bacterium]